MASYTALLKLTQPDLGATGWGTTVNSGVTALVEQAVAGAISVDITAGTSTLSAIASGASSDARNQFIVLTASPSRTSPSTLTVPAAPGATSSKLYFIKNSSGDAVTVETSGGTSVSVPNGKSMMLKVTTAGVEEAMTHAASLTLGTALPATSGGTGQSSYTIGDLLYASSTTALTKLAAAAVGNVLRAKGTGTAPAWEKADLTVDVTGVLPVANGGTGLSSPGTLGNVLRSDGAGNWTSGTLASATTSAEGLVELATDAEVQTGTDTTRAITPDALRKGALVLGTAVAASGTTIDFVGATGIPSWAKRVTIIFARVGTTGTNFIDIQIGDSGGIETTGYTGTQSNIIGGATGAVNYGGDAFEIRYVGGAYSISGHFVLTLTNPATNLWVGSGMHGADSGIAHTDFSAGQKALSGTLDRLRISAGGDTFDEGTINIMYE
jgi:hypothetical protein